MKKQIINLPEFILVGITTRTNNKNEMDPATSKIAALYNKYWCENIAEGIKHRKNPGVTYAVYTEYESDEHGNYTYFIGEVVKSIDDQDLSEFKTLTISKSTYQKFTTDIGKMPDVVISAWQKIWAMNETELTGKRKYLADFEIYDQRAIDPNQTVIDIYIGLQS